MVATVGVAMAQNRTISGTVTYAGDGEPLLGATVMPIGGGQGTSTNVDGKFSITVPSSVKKIRVSYVGMITKEVAAGTDLKIVMDHTDKSLDEVMVVAYGTAKKSAFTGSAAVLDASTIEQAQVSNALSAITGKVPGVQIMTNSGQPGSGPTQIRIRGISSIMAGNTPLVVVDGAPFAGDVNQINTNDIASMTVLKDAAANALYGARGANGVILITTKKGQNSGATVTLDAKWGVNTRATQDYNTIDDPRQYYEVYYSSLYNKFINDGMTPENAWLYANNNMIDSKDYGLGYQVFSYPESEMFIGRNGKVNPNAVYGRTINYNGMDYYIRPDNWLDETYRSSLRQEYNLSVSNNNDLTTFYASAGYLKNEGIIPNSSFERFSGRLSADTQAKPWLKVGGTMAYSHFDINSMDGDGSGNSLVNPLAFATSIAPIYPMYLRHADGSYMTNDDGLVRYDYGSGENAGLKRPVLSGGNGLSATIYDTNNTEGNTFNANGYADIRFLKDFKFTTNNSVYLQESRGTSVGNPYFGSSANQNGSVSKSHKRTIMWTYQQFLTWQHVFGKHDINVMVGHENNWQRTSYVGASKSGMFLPGNHELDGAVVKGNMSSYKSEYNNEGWLGRVQYDYDTKYFASASFRRDGSSRFHPDHRWGNFWSLGGAWLINKEEFFDIDWINMLKFKASYGEQGNDNIPDYIYTNRYTLVNDDDNPAVVAGSVKGNPDITWEKNGNFNVGVEFEMFNSRLYGNIEGFYRKTSDMLYQKALPVSAGYTNQWMNFGDMMNAGIEIDLQGTVIKTRDFTWDLNLNMTYVKNEVTRLPESSRSNGIDGHWGSASGQYYTGEGLPLYTWYVLDYAGVNPETGRAQYWRKVYAKDANGKPYKDSYGEFVVDHLEAVPLTEVTGQDRVLCGSAMAPVYGGFGTSFTYRGFDLSVDFSYQIGGKVMDSSYKGLMSNPISMSQGSAIHADVLKAWSPENPGSDIPRWQFGDEEGQASNRFLTDASYLSLQNINFGYSLPTSLISKLRLQKLRFYLSCDNVWLWSQRQGLDPRQSINGANSNNYYSPIRTISGGLTVVF